MVHVCLKDVWAYMYHARTGANCKMGALGCLALYHSLAFSDSIQAIMGQTGEGGRVSLDMWKHQYTTHFPQSVSFYIHMS